MFKFTLSPRPFRSAFTLIELLVVIAIIAILAAILFPVFGRARENARRTSCLSNTKQLGLGMMQYVQDYDEIYPMAFWDVNKSGAGFQDGANERGWAWNLQPYVKAVQLFQCPSDPVDPPNYSQISDTTGQQYIAYSDYAYNRAMGNPATGAVVPMAKLSFASNTVMFIETTGSPSGVSVFGGPDGGPATAPGRAIGRLDATLLASSPDKAYKSLTRHLEGSNIAFADGHSKWFKARLVPTGTKFAPTFDAVFNGATPVTASTYSFAIE